MILLRGGGGHMTLLYCISSSHVNQFTLYTPTCGLVSLYSSASGSAVRMRKSLFTPRWSKSWTMAER